jgi:hypothetical protein
LSHSGSALERGVKRCLAPQKGQKGAKMANLYKNGTIDHIEFLIENYDIETVLEYVSTLPFIYRRRVQKIYGLTFTTRAK